MTPVEIKTLPAAAAKALLMRISGREDSPDMDRLVAELDGLALAIIQAGAFLKQKPRTTIAAYADDVAAFLAKPPPGWKRDEVLVAATFEPSIRKAGEDARHARAVLQQASVFAPDALPEALLTDAEDDRDLGDALDALQRYSHIRLEGYSEHFGKLISFHRILGLIVRNSMSEGETEFALKNAARRISNSLRGAHNDERTWERSSVLITHLIVVAQRTAREYQSESLADSLMFVALISEAGFDVGDAVAKIGEKLAAWPIHEGPILFAERAVGIIRELPDDREEKLADYLSVLGRLYHAIGRLKDSEDAILASLKIRQRVLSPDHSKIAICLNNLAQLLQATNRLVEAEPLMRRALAIDEAAMGPDHPLVAIRLNNLASLLQATNRLAEAEPLIRRVISIFEGSFSETHPNLATALNNLAQLLQANNRLAEAEPLMRRALMIDEASFGPDHPEVATDLNNLAQLLLANNRLAEAEPLLRRALGIDEAAMGSDHPRVAIRLNNLVQLLLAKNRLAEAEPLMRRALKIAEASFGSDHPEVASSLNNLAQMLKATNRLAEAEPLIARHCDIFEASYGADHPQLGIAWVNHGLALLQLGRAQEGVERIKRAAANLEASGLPDGHPWLDGARSLMAQLREGGWPV